MIAKISFRAFVAITEDEDRVRAALSLFIPLDRIKSMKVEGHFGNEISILDGELGRKEALGFFQNLREQLPEENRKRLIREIPDRLEGNNLFHFRLDKQAAYNGLFRLTDSKDAVDISVLIKTFPARREEAINILSGLL